VIPAASLASSDVPELELVKRTGDDAALNARARGDLPWRFTRIPVFYTTEWSH